jgi:hypothetical protein
MSERKWMQAWDEGRWRDQRERREPWRWFDSLRIAMDEVNESHEDIVHVAGEDALCQGVAYGVTPPKFTVWSRERVYFPVSGGELSDFASSWSVVDSVPRNPCDERTSVDGNSE